MRWYLFIQIIFLCLLSFRLQAIPLSPHPADAVQYEIQLLQEDTSPLSAQQALAALQQSRFSPRTKDIISFGINARPVWLALTVANSDSKPQLRRILIENAWLDHLDLFIVEASGIARQFSSGDREQFSQRAVNHRFFAYDHSFPPGQTTVLIRAEQIDPMMLPVSLLGIEEANNRTLFQGYSYGLLYGAIGSLLFYNLMLFTGLRDRRYLLYSLYLSAFLAMNLSYTGHAFKWFWPESPHWQQMSNPLLMIAYIVCGLLFANVFLDLKTKCPRLCRALLAGTIALGLFALYTLITANQLMALKLAFACMAIFPLLMVILGVLALSRGDRSARYFLQGSVAAAFGVLITEASVWGLIPYTDLTYRAAEIGMLLDAILLAMALAYRIRIIEHDRSQAEQMARRDALTGLLNRRAFYELAEPAWNNAQRHQRNICALLLDVDHFKRINDRFGHSEGDKVLGDVARTMQQELRSFDILARWGGEEFIILLPETSFDEARAVAERIRCNIESMIQRQSDPSIRISASLGIAANSELAISLEGLIDQADQQLYAAKSQGRNRVCGHQPSVLAHRV